MAIHIAAVEIDFEIVHVLGLSGQASKKWPWHEPSESKPVNLLK